MSEEDEEETSEGEADEVYEVGYRKPPKSGQFKKGEPSRNPKGRPRKKRKVRRPLANDVRIAKRILSESRRPVKVRENGKIEEIPTIDAVLRSLAAGAMQGDTKAQVAYAQLTERAEATILRDWDALVDLAVDYIAGWQQKFELYDRRRIPRPEPVPHPDEIIIDHEAMEIRYNGPTSELQAERWEAQREEVRKAREAIREYRSDMRKAPELRSFYEREIAWEMVRITRIDAQLPSKEIRRAPGFDLRRWRAEKSVEGISTSELVKRQHPEIRGSRRDK